MPLPPRVRRSVTVLGVTAGLVGAFAAGTTVTGNDARDGDRTGPRPPGGDASPVAFTGSDLSLAESCDDLLDWYVARGVDRVGPYGWDYANGVYYDLPMEADAGGAFDDAPSVSNERAVPTPLAATSRVENDASGTNVQEAGVDDA